MTYVEWLNTLISPISSFIEWLSMVANSLLFNYFFITLLGLTLFVSLVWLVYDIFDFTIYSHINDYDDYENKYYDYSIYREVKEDYNKKHNIDNACPDSLDISNTTDIISSNNLEFTEDLKPNNPIDYSENNNYLNIPLHEIENYIQHHKVFYNPKVKLDTSSIPDVTGKAIAEYYYYIIGLDKETSLAHGLSSYDYLTATMDKELWLYKKAHFGKTKLDTSSIPDMTGKRIAEYYYYIIGLDKETSLAHGNKLFGYLTATMDKDVEDYFNNHIF